MLSNMKLCVNVLRLVTILKKTPSRCQKANLSNIENRVLWASSEKIGCAVNICHGMMEYWNVGILKTRV